MYVGVDFSFFALWGVKILRGCFFEFKTKLKC
jgi:hypothetical protein